MAERAKTKRGVGVVTGAAGGLGSATVVRLVDEGWRIAAIDLPSRLSNLEATLRKYGGRFGEDCLLLAADVSVEADVVVAFDRATDALGSIRLVVANAGIGGVEAEVADTTVEEFDRIVRANLRGVFLTCREGARRMRGGTGGSIVLTSSIFAQEPVLRTGVYSATKAGVIALAHVLALEMAPHNVRVNAIAPGYMATEMLRTAQVDRARVGGISLEQEIARVDGIIPLGRHGTGADFAAAVSFLVSDGASYVTGQTLGVNGGVVRR